MSPTDEDRQNIAVTGMSLADVGCIKKLNYAEIDAFLDLNSHKNYLYA